MTTGFPSRDDFAACLHTQFRVIDAPSEEFDLELAQVSELQKTAWQQSFSIFFSGPLARFFPQHIRQLSHPHLGELELFLVPVSQQGDAILYEAVFNLLIEAH